MELLPKISGYKIIKKLGRGGSGDVFLAKPKIGGEPVFEIQLALKVFRSEDISPNFTQRDKQKTINRAIAEFSRLARVSHENIVKVYQPTTFKDKTILPMSYVPGKNLEERLNPDSFDLKMVSCLINEVYSGMKYLHDKGFILRDLKLNNIIATENFKEVKICDLETLTSFYEHQVKNSSQGSKKYSDPQKIQSGNANKSSDYYALGSCLYYALNGEKPREKSLIPTINHITNLTQYEQNLRTGLAHLFNRINHFTSKNEFEERVPLMINLLHCVYGLLQYNPELRLNDKRIEKLRNLICALKLRTDFSTEADSMSLDELSNKLFNFKDYGYLVKLAESTGIVPDEPFFSEEFSKILKNEIVYDARNLSWVDKSNPARPSGKLRRYKGKDDYITSHSDLVLSFLKMRLISNTKTNSESVQMAYLCSAKEELSFYRNGLRRTNTAKNLEELFPQWLEINDLTKEAPNRETINLLLSDRKEDNLKIIKFTEEYSFKEN